jgi:transposase-like protein
MAKSVLNDARFHDEKAAFAYVERQLWPKGPVCPHCEAKGEKIGKLKGKTTRAGLYKCYACRKPFTVRIGTIFEDSHLPLHLWLQAIHLMCASKKGISTRQLQRMLGCGMKTAWHLGHRIREAMKDNPTGPLGGQGKHVEMDETYFGDKSEIRKRTRRGKATLSSKRAVVALVERGGSARTFHVQYADQATVNKILTENVHRKSQLHTDESRLYNHALDSVAGHHTIMHTANEYVRYGSKFDIYTNTVEGYFSVFKRGMRGVYQHCQEKHLHRYLAEFDFRYNQRIALGVDDVKRESAAIKGAKGKRLTYQTTGRPQQAEA